MNIPGQRILLSQIEPGEKGKVVQFLGDRYFIKECQDIGLRIGNKIQKTHQTPQSGVITIDYAGRKFPVDREMAEKILVELERTEDSLPPFTIKL